MKYCYLAIICAFLSLSINAQVITIPNGNFKNKLINGNVVDTNFDGLGDISLDTNDDGQIQVSEALAVTSLAVNNSSITSLQGIENFTNLTHLNFNSNNVSTVDLSQLTSLQVLSCSFNNLSTLDFSTLPNLTSLNIMYNHFTMLDVSGLANLVELKCLHNELLSIFLKNNNPAADLVTLIVSENPNLAHICADTVDYPVIQAALATAHLTPLLDSVCDPSSPCGPNVVCIADAKFKTKLISLGVDTNNDGKIQVTEAQAVTTLNLSSPENSTDGDITNLLGLEKFTNLETLNCKGNSITSLNASTLTKLKTIECSNNKITTLNISGLIKLETLTCNKNKITSLDMSGLIALKTVKAEENQLASITLTGAIALISLDVSNNYITAVDFTGLTAIESIDFSYNNVENFNFSGLTTLKSIDINKTSATSLILNNLPNLRYLNFSYTYVQQQDLTALTKLEKIYCDNAINLNFLDVTGLQYLKELFCKFTAISYLDLSGSPVLQKLSIDYTGSLVYLNIKNGSSIWAENFTHVLTALQYICVDQSELETIQDQIDASFDPEISTTCNFGEINNTITGVLRLDLDGTCQNSNVIFNHARLNSNGTFFNSTFTNASGQYEFTTMQNTITVTPVFQNGYFTAIPQSQSHIFPETGGSATADFCIVPNGVHHDLEINPSVVGTSRPGFKNGIFLTYKNNGNQIMSGTVNMAFDDNRTDFYMASPAAVQTPGNLSWNFTNLMPFESRTIKIAFLVNTPTATPPVNIGDVLEYTATVTSNSNVADENIPDNTSNFKTTVHGSFDPNDKTVLEGPYITIAQAQEYLHYLVRFQNTGNFPAETVRIEDVIAPEFDLTTLQIVDASHPNRVTLQGNKLKVYFDDINLAAASENEEASQGYIAFKIKPVSNSGTGTVFNNKAEIYFDFNEAIITNTVTTTIGTLSSDNFIFQDNFRIYPNPANTTINIDVMSDVAINSINIYNTLGQLLRSSTGTAADKNINIDISSLQSGQYFISIITDKGKATQKFIKL